MELLRELDEDYAQLEALIARDQPDQQRHPGGRGPAVRPAGPPGLHDRPTGDPPWFFKQRQQPGQPPDGGRDPDPQHCQRPGAAKAGGSAVQSLRELDTVIQETTNRDENSHHLHRRGMLRQPRPRGLGGHLMYGPTRRSCPAGRRRPPTTAWNSPGRFPPSGL